MRLRNPAAVVVPVFLDLAADQTVGSVGKGGQIRPSLVHWRRSAQT
jgi:hypothetical protein